MRPGLAGRLSRALVSWHPRRWRDRYGEEMLDVLDQHQPTARTVAAAQRADHRGCRLRRRLRRTEPGTGKNAQPQERANAETIRRLQTHTHAPIICRNHCPPEAGNLEIQSIFERCGNKTNGRRRVAPASASICDLRTKFLGFRNRTSAQTGVLLLPAHPNICRSSNCCSRARR